MARPTYMTGRPGIQPPPRLGGRPRGMDVFAQAYTKAAQPQNELLAKIYAAKKGSEPGMGETQKTAHYLGDKPQSMRDAWSSKYPVLGTLMPSAPDAIDAGTSVTTGPTGPSYTTDSSLDREKTIAETGRIDIQNLGDITEMKQIMNNAMMGEHGRNMEIKEFIYDTYFKQSDQDLIKGRTLGAPPDKYIPPAPSFLDVSDAIDDWIGKEGMSFEQQPVSERVAPPPVQQNLTQQPRTVTGYGQLRGRR